MSTYPWSKDSHVSDMLANYTDDENLMIAYDAKTKTAYSAGDDLAIAINEDVAVFRLSQRQPGGPVYSSKPDTVAYSVQQRTLDRMAGARTGIYFKNQMINGLTVGDIKGSELKSWLETCFNSQPTQPGPEYVYYK